MARIGDLVERDLHFIERVVTRLVDARRLAGRPDEHPREEVGQGRMVLPVGDDAAEQIGAPEEGAVCGRARAEHDVVAAAGAAVAAVDHEFFRAKPRLPRLLVKRLGDGDSFIPVRARDGCSLR